MPMEAVSFMSFNSKVTIKQIAAEAGVSTMTVSRVMNHPDKVHSKTRNRVLEASRRLNYHPNSVAQALSSGRSNIIYCYIPTDQASGNPFYLQIVTSMAEEFGDHGYSVLLSKQWYTGEAADGVILIGLKQDDRERAIELAKSKNVVVFGHLDGVDSIDVDNKLGMKMIGEYVIKSGKKNILYLSIDSSRDYVSDREDGFKEAVEGKADFTILHCPNDTIGSNAFLEANYPGSKHFDAICAASDEIALGAMNFLKHHGYRVPEDISVTGFDGLGRELLSVPAITTVAQPIVEVGHLLAARMIERIKEGKHCAEKRFVAPNLAINGSLL